MDYVIWNYVVIADQYGTAICGKVLYYEIVHPRTKVSDKKLISPPAYQYVDTFIQQTVTRL